MLFSFYLPLLLSCTTFQPWKTSLVLYISICPSFMIRYNDPTVHLYCLISLVNSCAFSLLILNTLSKFLYLSTFLKFPPPNHHFQLFTLQLFCSLSLSLSWSHLCLIVGETDLYIGLHLYSNKAGDFLLHNTVYLSRFPSFLSSILSQCPSTGRSSITIISAIL